MAFSGRWAAFSVPLPTEVVDELIPWVASGGGFPAVPTERSCVISFVGNENEFEPMKTRL